MGMTSLESNQISCYIYSTFYFFFTNINWTILDALRKARGHFIKKHIFHGKTSVSFFVRHKICTEKFHTPSLRKNNVRFQQKDKRWFDMRKTEVVS